jgi:molecular chaperone GrpE
MADENENGTTPENQSDPTGPQNDNDVPSKADVVALLSKAKNDYLYLMADFDNYRKNAIKERSELIKFGSERIIRDLLSIVDNFERAMENDANQEKFLEGIKMIHQEMKSFLQKAGVTELPAEGLAFDPSAHEALSSEPTDSVPAGHVSRVFKKAYKLHDRLIRPAQVVVATAPAENKNG